MKPVSLAFLAGFAFTTACATRPPSESEMLSASLIMWPRSAAGCDYAHPERDLAVVISTTYQRLIGTREALRAGRTYVVRDAQLLRPLVDAEVLCATVIRYREIEVPDAVYGFEVVASGEQVVRLVPTYSKRRSARLGSALAQVSIGVAEIVHDEVRAPRFGRLEFGAAAINGTDVGSSGVELQLPTGRLVRFAVVVTEGDRSSATDADLRRTLSERNRWDERS